MKSSSLPFALLLVLVVTTVLLQQPLAQAIPTTLPCTLGFLNVASGTPYNEGLILTVTQNCKVIAIGVTAPFIRLEATSAAPATGATIYISKLQSNNLLSHLVTNPFPAAAITFEGDGFTDVKSILITDISMMTVTLPDKFIGSFAFVAIAKKKSAASSAASPFSVVASFLIMNCQLTVVPAASPATVSPASIAFFSSYNDASALALPNATILNSHLTINAAPSVVGSVSLVHLRKGALSDSDAVKIDSVIVMGCSLTAQVQRSAQSQYVSLLQVDDGATVGTKNKNTNILIMNNELSMSTSSTMDSASVGTTVAPVANLISLCGPAACSMTSSSSTTTTTMRGAAPTEGAVIVRNVKVTTPDPNDILPSSSSSSSSTQQQQTLLVVFRVGSNSFDSTATTTVKWYIEGVRIAAVPSSTSSPRMADKYVSVFPPNVTVVSPGPGTMMIFGNNSWSCDPVQKTARVALEAGGRASIVVDGCFAPSGNLVTDLRLAATAFFSTAVVSAAAMSSVAFGLSRSQEVGEFVALAGQGACNGANATEKPIFSDSPLGLELSPEWCSYFGGTTVGNLGCTVAALIVSAIFGYVGCIARGRRVTIYRVLNFGYAGVVVSNCIGLFLTPTISHAALCAIRPQGHIAVRVVSGVIAFLLLFVIPIWVFLKVVRAQICDEGKLVKERQRRAGMSWCRRAVGTAWGFWFGAREWAWTGPLVVGLPSGMSPPTTSESSTAATNNSGDSSSAATAQEKKQKEGAYASSVVSSSSARFTALDLLTKSGGGSKFSNAMQRHKLQCLKKKFKARQQQKQQQNKTPAAGDDDPTAPPATTSKSGDENNAGDDHHLLYDDVREKQAAADDDNENDPPDVDVDFDIEPDEVEQDGEMIRWVDSRQWFHFMMPLFEDYAERCPHFFFYETLTQAIMGVPVLLAEAFEDGQTGCWAFGIPLVLLLLVYWLAFIYRRPLECRVMLVSTFGVSGLQLLSAALGLYTITFGGSKPGWATNIDIALVATQAALSLIGLIMVLKAMLTGGWRKLRACCCPSKADDDDEDEGARGEDNDAEDGGNYRAVLDGELLNEMKDIASGNPSPSRKEAELATAAVSVANEKRKHKHKEEEQQQQPPEARATSPAVSNEEESLL